MAASDGSEYFDVDTESGHDTFSRQSNAEEFRRDETELLWAAIERLPSRKEKKFALLKRPASESNGSEEKTETVDVTKLDRRNRSLIVRKALATSEQDNYKLLAAIKERFDRVGLEVPKVEVRFEKLNVAADVLIGSRALPTLVNYTRDVIERLLTCLRIFRPQRHHLSILKDISGSIKPGRMTLLLGPPGSGKSTLLLALAGKLDTKLKRSGMITYNGHAFHEFCVQRTSAYISQTDNHIAELTVRETLDFGARCEGEGFAGNLRELTRLEKENHIRPSPEVDAFMKACSVAGRRHSISTDYILKVLGLDVCSETVIGNDMVRGISGGQRKRVTTGEMVVGPRKTLFMDEISTGLDSSTTYQIVKCIKNFVHQMEATVLMALLQPAPETFNLFDDLVVLSEGHMVYEGPRERVLEFFESLGFQKPLRKGTADFLQEVTSRKDQAQYWAESSKPYEFIPVSKISEAYKSSIYGRSLESSLRVPFDKSKSHVSALRKKEYGVSKWKLFEACFSREYLLIKRHSFLYIFKTIQVAFVGFVTCTLFIRTRLHPTDVMDGTLYLGCLFFALVHMMFNGFSELPLMIFRLPVFYKQRDNHFYPAWAWSISSWILRVPYSAVEAVVWSVIVYYSVGFSPSAGRFFRHVFVLFSIHQMALGLFRTLAAVARNMIISNTFGSAALLVVFLLGGFIMPKEMIKPWWVWGFWLSPLSYAQSAIAVNEFTATRWKKKLTGTNTTVGYSVLHYHSLPTDDNWYWLGVGVLLLYALVFNIIVTLTLAYLNPLKNAQMVLPDATENDSTRAGAGNQPSPAKADTGSRRQGMTLPFKPLSMTFHNINYLVDMPKDMALEGITERKLQLLSDVSGVFLPGVLTALMGSSGAGKTTLMDVLAGRKTGGYIEGEINISGFQKEQGTFARVSGYVEQNDIHSPQVTVIESLLFSAFLRLPADVNAKQRRDFVEGVMKLVELDNLRDALVGLPGSTGLSTEQRKRLTIAVELVANPSIIFMDEPTSGLDARAAAIVMRTIRNTVDTGRTVVCTIHQPSNEIFEAFDELLLMKRGGHVIYGGKVGERSEILIKYFESINGISPMPSEYNPANWMLEMTTPAVEERIGQDFAVIYKNSKQYRDIEALIRQTSTPQPGSEPLYFSSTYSRSGLLQFQTCFWKQNLVYWRSPEYNAVRLFFTTMCALIVGSVFWDVGSKRNNSQNLMVVMGALYTAVMFLGVNNSSSVQPVIAIERTVFYRERAAGMYSAIPYAIAQGLVEIPYIAIQTIVYGITTFFMINFQRTIGKLLLYLVFMFLTFTYFTFYGMLAIGLTPSQQIAAVVSSAFYSLWNLLAGFLVPKPKIPGWWIWFYYICPISWTLQGLIGSQLADLEEPIVGPGFQGTVKGYLKEALGIESNMIGISALVLFAFSVFFFLVFALSLKFLNFQKR
ncbi:ABC transporter G family member 31 [Cynara cardunculus var. scolymus]|uniref:ABC transporter G family member 31 n=1 Tax=Cynara cardunculus var. scolymus TaxID=59895 RepID=UPI000D62BDFE|nr:ABC transporter G family member 31 [Cynara cardunculus var. scolymus]